MKYILLAVLILFLAPQIVSATHDVNINSPANDTWVNGTIEIDYNTTEPSPNFCYMNVNGNTTPFGCFTSLSFNTNQCDDGSSTCNLEITVTAGHGNASDSVNFSVDNSPPTISTVTLNVSVAQQGDAISIISDGDDPHGVKSCGAYLRNSDGEDIKFYALKESGGDVCDDNETLPNPLEEGAYTVHVRIRNKVGAEAWASSGSLLINNSLPMAEITSPSENDVLSELVNITGTAYDDSLDNYKLEFCQNSCTEITSSETPVTDSLLGNWSTFANENGDYVLKLTVSDKAGNVATDEINVSLNNSVALPHNFSGYVSVGGVKLGNGSTLTARINGEVVKSIEIINGMYGIGSVFSIPGDNLTTPGSEGGVNGDSIEFFVDGTKTNEEFVFQSNSVSVLNLTLESDSFASIDKIPSNGTITLEYSNTDLGVDIEIDVIYNVTETQINISKFIKNFLVPFSGPDKFIESISIEINESLVERFILTIFYTSGELDSDDLNENNLRIMRFNESSFEWKEVSTDIDETNNFITADLTSAGMFALVGTQTCSDGIENQNEEGVDCGGSCSDACNEPDGQDNNVQCEEFWECSEWSECTDNEQIRDCDDLNNCGTDDFKPSELRPCDEIICIIGERECDGDNVRECIDGVEWDTVENCDFGCSEGECLAENATQLPQVPQIQDNTTISPESITGFFTADNVVFVSGLIIGIIVIVVAVGLSRKRQKPVYKAFRYEYKT